MTNAIRRLASGKGKLGVTGGGNMGPGIAQSFAVGLGGRDPRNWPQIVIVDVVEAALEAARASFVADVLRGDQAAAARMDERVTFTSDFGALADSDVVIEAATENLVLKRESVLPAIVANVRHDTIIGLNSSTFPRQKFLDVVPNPERLVNLHGFFPSRVNPVVEIAHDDDHTELAEALWRLYRSIGRYPIRVAPVPAFALNRIFIALAKGMIDLVESGRVSIAEVDQVLMATIGVPIFITSDMIGGTPILLHSLPVLGEEFMPWFTVPELLRTKAEAKESWTATSGEVALTEEKEALIRRTFHATVLGVWGLVVDDSVCEVEPMDTAVQIAFRFPSLLGLFRKVGPAQVLSDIEHFAGENPGFRVSDFVRTNAKESKSVSSGGVPPLEITSHGKVAIICLDRPLAGNAVNAATLAALQSAFMEVRNSDDYIGAVVTGALSFFSAGADVKAIGAALSNPDEARPLINRGKEVFQEVLSIGKPVVAALNGMAFGGGLELPLHCDGRIAAPGVLLGLPEVTLGICPGWGGMVRLPRLIPNKIDLAVQMIRTGAPISSEQALEVGLVDEIVPQGEVIERAVTMVALMAAGLLAPMELAVGPVEFPSELPPVGSTASPTGDPVIVEALRVICGAGEVEGYETETSVFIQLLGTPNARVGVEHFLKPGKPKEKGPTPWVTE